MNDDLNKTRNHLITSNHDVRNELGALNTTLILKVFIILFSNMTLLSLLILAACRKCLSYKLVRHNSPIGFFVIHWKRISLRLWKGLGFHTTWRTKNVFYPSSSWKSQRQKNSLVLNSKNSPSLAFKPSNFLTLSSNAKRIAVRSLLWNHLL